MVQGLGVRFWAFRFRLRGLGWLVANGRHNWERAALKVDELGFTVYKFGVLSAQKRALERAGLLQTPPRACALRVYATCANYICACAGMCMHASEHAFCTLVRVMYA